MPKVLRKKHKRQRTERDARGKQRQEQHPSRQRTDADAEEEEEEEDIVLVLTEEEEEDQVEEDDDEVVLHDDDDDDDEEEEEEDDDDDDQDQEEPRAELAKPRKRLRRGAVRSQEAEAAATDTPAPAPVPATTSLLTMEDIESQLHGSAPSSATELLLRLCTEGFNGSMDPAVCDHVVARCLQCGAQPAAAVLARVEDRSPHHASTTTTTTTCPTTPATSSTSTGTTTCFHASVADGQSQLFVALCRAAPAALSHVLKPFAQRDIDGPPLLHMCCAEGVPVAGLLAVLEVVGSVGVDADSRLMTRLRNTQADSETALHWAVEASNELAVSALLSVDPGLVGIADAQAVSPLMCAALCGNRNIVEDLLRNGADTLSAARDESGWFPLCYAVHAENVHVALCLLQWNRMQGVRQLVALGQLLAQQEMHLDGVAERSIVDVFRKLAEVPAFHAELNAILAAQPHLLEEDLAYLVRSMPSLLSLPVKLRWAASHMQLSSSRQRLYDPEARRALIIPLPRGEAWDHLVRYADVPSGTEACRPFLLQFAGEPGVGPGVEREVLEVLASQFSAKRLTDTADPPRYLYRPRVTEVSVRLLGQQQQDNNLQRNGRFRCSHPSPPPPPAVLVRGSCSGRNGSNRGSRRNHQVSEGQVCALQDDFAAFGKLVALLLLRRLLHTTIAPPHADGLLTGALPAPSTAAAPVLPLELTLSFWQALVRRVALAANPLGADDGDNSVVAAAGEEEQEQEDEEAQEEGEQKAQRKDIEEQDRAFAQELERLSQEDIGMHKMLMEILASQTGGGDGVRVDGAAVLDVEDLDLTMSVMSDDGKAEVDLISRGRTVDVTNERRDEYVRSMLHYLLRTRMEWAAAETASGMQDVIPARVLSVFQAEELQCLIAGTQEINVSQWRRTTEWRAEPSCRLDTFIAWFWEVVSAQLSAFERALFLQLWTGSSRLPANGFEGLSPQPCVTVIPPSDALPSAATCFHLLRIPRYPSRDVLARKILCAVRYGARGFSFA